MAGKDQTRCLHRKHLLLTTRIKYSPFETLSISVIKFLSELLLTAAFRGLEDWIR